MKKNTYIVLGAIIVILILVGGASLVSKQGDDMKNPTSGKLVTGSDLETFSGTITAVDTSCFSDGICSVSVDGKKIILVKGGRGQPQDIKVGKLLGVDSIGDLESRIGDHANVYATTTPEGDYSLYGNNNYYVEVVTIMNKDTSMNGMMMDMSAGLKGKTGDAFDQAFLSEMIVHHQGAVEMAQLALKNAKHKEIKDLAEKIIVAQNKEIADMKEWQKKWYQK